MIECTCHTARHAGVTLVRGVLDARSVVSGVAAYDVTVRLSVPDPRWVPEWLDQDDDTVVVTVPAGGIRGIGFACREPVTSEPLSVDSVEPATEEPADIEPDAIQAELWDPAPPRAAVAGDSEWVEAPTSVGRMGSPAIVPQVRQRAVRADRGQ